MATAVLSVAGGAIGGPFGQIAGGLLGSYIDNAFLLPALDPKDPIEGFRINREFEIQTAEEGAPGNFPIGPDNRLAGTLVWQSPLIEEQSSQDSGGKGGSSQEVTSYAYFVHLAIAIAEREIEGIERIYCDGKKLYDANPDQTYQGSNVRARVKRPLEIDYYIEGSDQAGDFLDGIDLQVSGFNNPANNGTFRVKDVQYFAGSNSTRIRVATPTPGVSEPIGAAVTLFQAQPVFVPSRVENVGIYLGTNTQNPDALIESFEGSGLVPGWRGRAYVVLQKLALGDYGNRIPQVSFVLKADTDGNVETAIEKIFAAAGRGPATFDASSLSGITFRGFPIRGRFSPAQGLQPISSAYDVLDQEREGGLIAFFERSKAPRVPVREEDLRAHEDGSERPGPVEVLQESGEELPRSCVVSYLDHEADHARGSQEQPRRNVTVGKDVSVNLPIVLEGAATEARQIARRTVWVGRMEKDKVFVPLPPRYLHVLENDLLEGVQVHDRVLDLLVRTVDVGDNWRVEAQCVPQVDTTLAQLGIGESPGGVKPKPTRVAPNVDIVAGDIPGIPTTTVGDPPTIIIGGANTGTETTWAGLTVWDSDDDLAFELGAQVTTEARIGASDTELGDADGGGWDRENTVDVDIVHGELVSVTEAECLAGKNRALLGGEVIGFEVATLIEPGVYRLSKLLRGLRNTLDQTDQHAIGDVFMLLDQALVSTALNPYRLDQDRYRKVVAFGGDLDDVDSVPYSVEGRNVTPFGPASVKGEGTDERLISWIPRTRAITSLWGPVPVMEREERFEVDIIYPVGSNTVVRTKQVADAHSVVYTTGEQDQDGTRGAKTDVLVYQMSEYVGRGTPSERITTQ